MADFLLFGDVAACCSLASEIYQTFAHQGISDEYSRLREDLDELRLKLETVQREIGDDFGFLADDFGSHLDDVPPLCLPLWDFMNDSLPCPSAAPINYQVEDPFAWVRPEDIAHVHCRINSIETPNLDTAMATCREMSHETCLENIDSNKSGIALWPTSTIHCKPMHNATRPLYCGDDDGVNEPLA
ncbi:hypothetical protein SPBR_06194 [Sporothrix brasiliensis 5110]|uniref:Uncharacterized protein n=1 Tax=Sporothrix brasiliensis 5110 TaxID=1398154 RepID=A0A0C2F5T0_9PEZI|nr:uncharacterized protein SPBR_06194 [Sporothrix brasiliensis 5110]KIH94259.1 hypothetical protein SPBR_06194 [Sporothrix brasiliensis 5110]